MQVTLSVPRRRQAQDQPTFLPAQHLKALNLRDFLRPEIPTFEHPGKRRR
jgi:hypothetical protein